LTGETGPATAAAPLMEMPVHPVPHVAVSPPNTPPSVTGKLVTVELVDTPTWLAKENALGVPPLCVVTVHVEETEPIVTVALTAALYVEEDVTVMANVLPLLTLETGPAIGVAPLMEMRQPVQVAVRPPNPPAKVMVLLCVAVDNSALGKPL
jgi:hypothetical protein